jgi:hypothetical protein
MIISNVFRSRVLAVGLVAAVVLLMTPATEFAQQGRVAAPAPAPSNGSLVGFIYAKDMKTPVAQAVVKLRDIKSMKEFDSRPTDANGMYKITGLPEGRYILGVTTATGNFNFDYALIIKGNEMAKLSVALTPGGKTTGEDAAAKSFFADPQNVVGVVIMVAGAAAMTYLIIQSEQKEASPIK